MASSYLGTVKVTRSRSFEANAPGREEGGLSTEKRLSHKPSGASEADMLLQLDPLYFAVANRYAPDPLTRDPQQQRKRVAQQLSLGAITRDMRLAVSPSGTGVCRLEHVLARRCGSRNHNHSPLYAVASGCSA